MGTNLYARYREEEIHIGKSSGGWCFSLHCIPERELNSLADWKMFLMQDGIEIYTEYGRELTLQELLEQYIEKDRSWFGKPPQRHTIGDHCVGHGEGHWDLIVGWFR